MKTKKLLAGLGAVAVMSTGALIGSAGHAYAETPSVYCSSIKVTGTVVKIHQHSNGTGWVFLSVKGDNSPGVINDPYGYQQGSWKDTAGTYISGWVSTKYIAFSGCHKID